jgi:hypothetical protein
MPTRRKGGENWAQFELGEPKTEAATLAQLEASLHLLNAAGTRMPLPMFTCVAKPLSGRLAKI